MGRTDCRSAFFLTAFSCAHTVVGAMEQYHMTARRQALIQVRHSSRLLLINLSCQGRMISICCFSRRQADASNTRYQTQDQQLTFKTTELYSSAYASLIIYFKKKHHPCSRHASSSILMSHQAIMKSSMRPSPVNHKSSP